MRVQIQPLDDVHRPERLIDVLEPHPHQRYPLTAPTSKPRAMCFCRNAAMTMTGAIMMTISTDMYHHCGPRVVFCAATSTGMVWALALVRKSASRNSFQARMKTSM